MILVKREYTGQNRPAGLIQEGFKNTVLLIDHAVWWEALVDGLATVRKKNLDFQTFDPFFLSEENHLLTQ